jgi:hypothetical protein
MAGFVLLIELLKLAVGIGGCIAAFYLAKMLRNSNWPTTRTSVHSRNSQLHGKLAACL